MVLEKTLESPLTSRRSNQSILMEMNPWCSLEGLMLQLKLQYFGHLMRRADSLEKTLILGKTEGRRRGMTKDEMVGWHLPGSSPSGSRVIRSVDGIGKEKFIYLFI